MNQLEMLVQRKTQAAGQESGVEQRHIFEQYTNVLTACDPATVAAGGRRSAMGRYCFRRSDFHLSRRIGASRILLVGTYRPDEVALGRSGEAHPLAKVLAELKRYFGELQVTLHQEDEAAGRRFVIRCWTRNRIA